MRARVLAVVAVTVVVVVAATAYVLTRAPSAPEPMAQRQVRIPTTNVPDGVSGYDVHHHRFFVVRHRSAVTAFADDAQHLAGERLWWCPSEHVFAAPTHGELFDTRGRKLDGPSRGDLNRYRARVEGSDVVVTVSRALPGPVARGVAADGAIQFANFDRGWNAGTGSFCAGAVSTDGPV